MARGVRIGRVLGGGLALCTMLLAPGLGARTQVRAVTSGATPACPIDAGVGGQGSSTFATTRGGHGCVLIIAGSTQHTFTYTGAIEQWTVPAGVTTVTVHMLGAGGGGSRPNIGAGGGGGYVGGTLTVTPGQVLDIVVGQGGVRHCAADVPPLTPASARHNATFGGGGSGNTSSDLNFDCSFASGGGRSAIRLSGGVDDLVTAGGGGGAGYGASGGAGGGASGLSGGGCGGAGGSQVAGGATCNTFEPGTAGIKYAGGWAGYSATNERAGSEGGGGGGGYYGGGAAGDNGGGGGGSSYLGSLSNSQTFAGNGSENGMPNPVNSAPPTLAGQNIHGATLTATSGTWTGGGTNSWTWQSSTDGVNYTDIPGQTSSTYVVATSGYIRAVETRSTPFRSASAATNSVNVAPTTTTNPPTTTTMSRSTTTTAPAVPVVTTVTPTTAAPDASAPQPQNPDTPTALGNLVPTGVPQTNPFTATDAQPRYLFLDAAIAVGSRAAGAPLDSQAAGLKPGSTVTLTVRSTPTVIATAVADATGRARFPSQVPDGLEPGIHTLTLSGITPDGVTVTATAAFTVDANGIVGGFSPAGESLSGIPTEDHLARAATVGVPTYDTAANAATTARIAVTASLLGVLMVASAAAGAADRRRGSGATSSNDSDEASRDDSAQGEIGSLEADSMDIAEADDRGWGDRSRTWDLPLTQRHQSMVEHVHARVSTKSAALARLVDDGHWLRASFGSIQLVVWLAALISGLAAGASVDALVAPSFAWVSLICVLAFVDAGAGLLAWIGFACVTLARFGFGGVWDARVLLGLGVLYMGIPLVANHARPLRRVISSRIGRVDRVADYVMLPILMGFASKSIYTALNGLSGLTLVTGQQASTFAWLVIGLVVARLGIEDVVSRVYPARMVGTAMPSTSGTPLSVDLATLLVKDALFLLAAGTFLGFGWRTWLVVALMTVIPCAKLFASHLPNLTWLHRWFPRGVMRAVIMVWFGAWYSGIVLGANSSPEHTRAMMAVLMIPGLAVGAIDLFGRSSVGWPNTLWKRLIGGALWCVSFGVMFGLISAG